ncbi:signal recognition particle protein [Geothrix rubra]|uniref:Signal recognition particle protein n=1 Tax=Geothrix rubra TaxID=2927977 RepID=A0ABQ5Q5R2_9BACT|nr:signal recognition particle protein [Geothrix rubra]GLH70105.1 signal recognition particle protein [Geothrix rubra]
MFDSLSQKLSQAMKALRGETRLTEANLEAVLREVRMALLEADVHVAVARTFLQRVKEKALGAEVMQGLNPAQAFIDIVHRELVEIMGGEAPEHPLAFAPKPPTVVMMVGLQGAGKTTTCGKLAVFLKKLGRSPLLVPADVYRPAAIEQLHVVAKDAGVPSFRTDEKDPVRICEAALTEAKLKGWDTVILDTAGRLHLDEALMEELVSIKAAVPPDEILFVADAMTGQDAVRSATAFHGKLGTTGVVLTKTDGDTRGGAAFSIKQATGTPLKFVGEGEKLEDFQRFHPDRMAQRILGMGDVLSLIEHAKDKLDEKETEAMAQRLAKNQFTLEDMRKQFQQVKKLGSMNKILGMLPGMGQMKEQIAQVATDKRLSHMEAILNSMTPKERANHNLLDAKRKRRIAAGSGRPVSEINQLLKQYVEARKMMGQMNDPKFMNRMQRMAGAMKGKLPF